MSAVQINMLPNATRGAIQMYIVRDESVDAWIRERHYLRSTPATAIIRMRFEDAAHRIVGCMMWGHPTARRLDQVAILELSRMCFIDDTEPYIESKCLAMARKHIRKYNSRIKGLIAYSSTGQSHEGVVYKADGWYELGRHTPARWGNRPGRVDRDTSDKIRWTRSV
jgi:hypothetical protein